LARQKEAAPMAKSSNPKRKKTPKAVLRLPDLEQSKSAFNKTVVTRYRIALEQKHYAPSTINPRLAAVRRLAYEASDSGY
jgi:hypothetical protein